MTHEQLIAKCTQWFWNEFPEERRMLYAVNNNSTNWLDGQRNKAKGVIPGVLDLCYVLPRVVAWLDAKIGSDRLSREQEDFCEKVTDRHHLWFTFSSFEEFQEIIKWLQQTYMI